MVILNTAKMKNGSEEPATHDVEQLHKHFRKALGMNITISNTPVAELQAGNITESLNRDVLKVISSEVNKSTQLHDDVILELILTQRIIRECDSHYQNWPGYIQHLQIDPFAVHMYTEQGLSILVSHLQGKKPICLYLDATGSIVTRIPLNVM